LSVVIPISVLFMVLRYEVVMILFQRGKFDKVATGHTATVLIFMLAGSFAFAANTIIPRAYYATQDTLFPAIYGTVAVLLSIPLYLLGLNMMGAGGVALAATLSAILQVLLLYAIWNRRTKNENSRPVYLLYTKMLVFSIPLGLFLARFKSALLSRIDNSTLSGGLMVCSIVGVVFGLILLAAGYGLKINEITVLVKKLKEKFSAS
jgi:putative peptidoglycan lipid II flippase